MNMTRNEIVELIKAAEDRARRALEKGNDVGHRIHMDRADMLRQELPKAGA